MRPPKRRHSDPRNSHMASLVFEIPVLVSNPWPPWTTSGSGAVTLAKGSHLLVDIVDLLGVGDVVVAVALGPTAGGDVVQRGVGIVGVLGDPAVQAGDHDEAAGDAEPQ